MSAVAKSIYYQADVNYNTAMGDFNGDRKIDMLGGSGAYWYIYQSTGTDWNVTQFQFNKIPHSVDDDIIAADYNGDGKTDIAHAYLNYVNGVASSSTYDVYYSTGKGFYREQYTNSIMTDLVYASSSDLDGDGKSELLVQNPPGTFVPNGTSGIPYKALSFKKEGQEYLLEKVKNGLRHVTQWTYKRMNHSRDFYTQGAVIGNPNTAGVRVPVNNLMLPINLVAEMTADNGVRGGKNTIQFAYSEAKLHKEGKGLLGFKSITTKNLTSGVTSVTNNNFNQTYFMFEPSNTQNILTSTNFVLSKTEYQNAFTDLGNKRFWFKNTALQEYNYLEGKSSYSSMTYDTDGNVTNSSSNISTIQPLATLETSTTTNEYVAVAPNTTYASKPSKITVNKTRAGTSPYSLTTTFAYNTTTGFLEKKIDYQNFATSITSIYGYNTKGNMTSITVTPTGMTQRVTSSVYDAMGRYPLSQTNELGQSSTTAYHTVWGKPISSTGIDGITNTYVYDNFGRLVSTNINDNQAANLKYAITESYVWDNNDIKGTRYFHWVQHPGKPDTKVYYDMLNRPVIKETEGYVPLTVPPTAALWNTEKTTYDARGNVATTTTPYQGNGTGVNLPITTTNSYDIYNRLISSTPSNTDFAKTTYEYNYAAGELTTKIKNWTGVLTFQEKSAVTDATGKTISSTDYGGTLSFSYYSHDKVKEVKNGTTQLSYSEYDDHLNQTKLIDVNGGTTTYEYDALNQLKKQTNANAQVTTILYDIIGRVTSRTEPVGTTTYEFYTTPNTPSVNQLKKVTGFANANKEDYTYDVLGRLISQTEFIDNATTGYTTTCTYNKYGDMLTMVYPSAFQVNYAYNANGYLETVKGGNSAATLKDIFTNKSMNSFNQYTKYTLGNGKISENTYNNGIPTSYYTAGTQYLTFNWNLKTGNLMGRADALKNKTESFTYDNQNRLLTGAGGTPFTINYAANGNITSKSDAGTYDYATPKINAVSKINCVANIPLLTQTVTYNDFFQPDKVIEGAFELNYTYASDYQRIKSELKNNNVVTNTRYYFGDYEKDITAATTRHIHYISAGQGLVAIVVREGSTDSYFFTYTDYLGSILTVTNDAGTIVAEQSFDAWGRKRNPTTWAYTAIPSVPVWLYRGYTGHEHLPQFGLINMNGRMYDPVVGRMLSVDNYVHGGTQGYNRYSYAMNNPLRYTDPSGEIVIAASMAIGAAVSIITNGIGNLQNGAGFWEGAGKAAFWGAIGGAVSGGIGNVAKSMLAQGMNKFMVAGLQAYAHGVTGGIMAGAQGGNGGAGFAAGFISSGIASGINFGGGGPIGQILGGGLSGGISSSMAGGNFWDGARQGLITAGLNHVAHLTFDGDDPKPKTKTQQKWEKADAVATVTGGGTGGMGLAAEELSAMSNGNKLLGGISKTLSVVGKVSGVTGVLASGAEAYYEYQEKGTVSYGTMTKIAWNTALVASSFSPVGWVAKGGAILGIYDAATDVVGLKSQFFKF